MALPSVVTSVVQFLRAGYPNGVPNRDYLPLFALLRRRLTDDEVQRVADTLAETGDPLSAAAIHEAISRVTQEEPSTEDINRVRACLAAGGWPLADPAELISLRRDTRTDE